MATTTINVSTSLEIDVTPITGGTSGRVLFEKADNTLGQDSNLTWLNGVFSVKDIEIRSDFQTNTFIGRNAGIANTPLSTTQGRQNTFIGSDAGAKNTTGYASLNIGFAAGFENTTGSVNTNIGYQAGFGNVIGNFNVNLGTDAGARNTANSNMFIGYHSGFGFPAVSTGIENIFIGNETATNTTTAFSNVMLGFRAGFALTSGASNVVLGAQTGGALTTGVENILIGRQAGAALTTGTNNVFIGHRTGFSASTSTFNNTGVGNNSLFSITTGNRNTGIGSGSGISITTGTFNTFIGFNSGNNVSQLASASNSTAIGNGSFTTKNNQVVIGNTSVVETVLNGTVLVSLQAVAPTGIEGAIYYDSVLKKHYGYDGTTWNAFY